MNDELGHVIGDEVLRNVAMMSSRAVRRADVVSRYGGEEILCEEVMKRGVECCFAHENIVSVAQRMRDLNIGFLPVRDAPGVVVGSITDRDITTRVVAPGLSLLRTHVEHAMTRGAVTCAPDDELAIAEDRMSRYRKARIVCVDARGRPVGVISLSDVARVEPELKSGDLLRAVTLRAARPHS